MKKNNKKAPRQKQKKLITIKSTQMWSPIKDVKDGIVITKDERFVQLLEFAPINFSLLPIGEQDKIADTFGSAIRTFPNKFQIKVLSRKANVETHVRDLMSCMERETNPQCRNMQMQSLQQIRSDAIDGVSRRFFLSFEYEAPSGFRRPGWEEIKSSLQFQAQQIASMLSANPCNNALLSPIGSTDHALDILYNCMCRAEAELKPFDTKIQDVIATHVVENGYNQDPNAIIPVNDFVVPRRINRDAFSYIEVDGKYYTFGYIHNKSYPTRCVAGWLSNLVNLGEGFDVDIWVEQRPTKEIAPKLTYAMQISQSNYSHKTTTSADIVELENKIESENYIRQGLTNGHTFLYFSVMITAVGDNLQEMKAKYKAVQDAMTAYDLTLKNLNGNHDIALSASVPLCTIENRVLRFARRNILSGDFGSAYPFTSYEINDPNGVMLGRNKANNSPLFLDLFNRYIYSNGNCVIYGGSGSGKTYTLQCMALRQRQYQTRVIIIAPYKGHEYRPACHAIGGSFISLAPGSPHNINVMEIRKHKISGEVMVDGTTPASGSLLVEKIQQLHTFFSLLKPDMSHRETQILDEALQNTYRKFGITSGNKSLYDPLNPTKFKQMPVLGDLYNELQRSGKDAKAMLDAMSRFVSGSCKSFNGPTNVNLDNPYVVIDISNMPDALLPIGIFIANDYVYDSIRADEFERKLIINDELSRLIGPAGTKEVAKFVLWEFKTVRAYNCCIIAATQDTNDFFALNDGHYGKGILANAKIKLVMKQEPEEVPTITKSLLLSETEASNLMHYNPGEGLLIANRNHTEIQVVASMAEDMLINTNPEIKKQRYYGGTYD